MKKIVSLSLVFLGVLIVIGALMPPRNSGEFNLVGFGQLPVVVNGRIKPLDTVARTSLVVLQSSQSAYAPDGTTNKRIAPTEWLLDVLFNSKKADTYQHFEINHDEVLAIFSLRHEDGRDGKRFSFQQLQKKFPELEKQVRLVEPVDPKLRTTFQKAVVQLYSNLGLYLRLRGSLVAPDHGDFLGELMDFQKFVAEGVAAVRAKQAGKPHDAALVEKVLESGERFDRMNELASLYGIPPDEESNTTGWKRVGESLLETFQNGRVNSTAMVYAGLARTWRAGQAKEFNELLGLYRAQLEKGFTKTLKKDAAEARFNAAQPFYWGIWIYTLAFFVAVISWLVWPKELANAAFYLVAMAWLFTTVGILTRMWLEGRPPVTNLYSSALFVGWVAGLFCVIMERIFRNSIASVAAAVIGVPTLIIAHHLALEGDTLEMMEAVLDSNFWLSTHVITVVAGYGATYLAGALALVFVFRGMLTKSMNLALADTLARMIYGIVCFATLFSLVGTVLGGIWADQSWGRFWGWDPKENGALIIVLWNALILHARWGGLVKQRGMAALAIAGNIVTSWSWWGVNLLGVGLHSYGFMEGAFFWLVAFALSQLAIIGFVWARPLEQWRAFRDEKPVAPRGVPQGTS